MPSGNRWQPGQGPGTRRLPWIIHAKRWVVERILRDARMRRMALNRIFSEHTAVRTLCLVPFGDHHVFVDPKDDRIGYSLLTGRPWQRQQIDRAIALATQHKPADGDTFVDIGANIGLMTIHALQNGPFARAVAVEPDPWNRSVLRKNLEMNRLTDRVEIIAKAVSDTSGMLPLHQDAKNLGAHSLEPGFSLSPTASLDVQIDRLGNMLAEVGCEPADIGMIKIDVEGHEFAVLAGMADLLRQVQPPIMIEATFDADEMASGGTRLSQPLPDYGSVCDLEDDQQNPRPLDTFQATQSQHELLIY